MRRTIFHVDMDAFYASVEQRDRPEFRGRPVIVGADPQEGKGRGVVAACSYEARKFGIHSAMPIGQAYRRCPDGVFLRPDMAKYSEASRRIREMFRKLTSQVEPISIDEAFLDVSEKASDEREAIRLARRLKAGIFRRHRLTASVGIGPSKFIAKIASDIRKPNGLFLVREAQVQRFLDPLPISRLWGVGPRTEERLRAMGISRIRELRESDPEALAARFGKLGAHLWDLARGIDPRPVVVQRPVKSMGRESTFPEDTDDRRVVEGTLDRLCLRVADRLKKKGLEGGTVTLKLRYADFTTLTRQESVRDPVGEAETLQFLARRLLHRHVDGSQKIRLIGVAVSRLTEVRGRRQLRLW